MNNNTNYINTKKWKTLKGVSKTIQNKEKEQKGGFLSISLDTLGASLVGNMLTEKEINRAEDGIIRAGYGSSKHKNFKFHHLL